MYWIPLLLVCATAATKPHRIGAAPLVRLWDTRTSVGETLPATTTNDWQLVPSDLLSLEKDPAKASSDPGYYGREYSFKGDAIVENDYLAAIFASADGRVTLYSKLNPKDAAGAAQPFGRKIADLGPLQSGPQPGPIQRLQILRNAEDEVALEVFFSVKGSEPAACVFDFTKDQIIEIKPAPALKGLQIRANLDAGIVPDFVADDLIYSPADYPAAKKLALPAEHLFLGLVAGESDELVMTWPAGRQHLELDLQTDPSGKRRIDSIDFQNDGQSLYLATLSAPGVWHRQPLPMDYLEKDAALGWKRPYPAKWKTQLYEEGARTTFAFRPAKGEIWRGVPGSYEYPAWFDGEQGQFHLGKKVPPKGDAVIYCVEPQNTPLGILTPSEILRQTLGRAACEPILDLAGRKLRTHHRRGAEGVRRACTCGCTEAIQTIFETGQEAARKEQVKAELEDMIYFVHRHVERIDQYRRFAKELQAFVEAKAAAVPALRPYLQGLGGIAARIEEEYSVQQENMKSFAYADELTAQTLTLCDRKNTNNLAAYRELLKSWRGMGGAQDYVLAQCHTITRKLFQEAGYTCVEQPEAVALAIEIRSRCRQCLRHPDGYEIWPDY